MIFTSTSEVLHRLFGATVACALERHGTIVFFAADECLFNNSIMQHDMLYFLLRGEVRSFYSIDSSHLLVCENGAGDLLNEEGLYGYGSSSTAITLTEGMVLALPYTMVHALLQQTPSLALLLLKNLSNKVYGNPNVAAA